jgi:hypothetical protein
MVSSLTRNQVPGNRLRVRIPCPPLRKSFDIKCLRSLRASARTPCWGKVSPRVSPRLCVIRWPTGKCKASEEYGDDRQECPSL